MENQQVKSEPKKRINIVSLQLVKESSVLYAGRKCNSPQALYQLFSPFIENKDREHLIMAACDQKLQPNVIQTFTSAQLINR